MIFQGLKSSLRQSALLGGLYVSLRAKFHRALKLKLHLRDARHTWRDMKWLSNAKDNYWATSAELLFQYHKLEKGLCMPGAPRFFGYDPATATMDILDRWRLADYPVESRIYRGALATLHAYRKRLEATPPPNGARLLQRLDTLVASHPDVAADVATPMSADAVSQSIQLSPQAFDSLMTARRSVRNFEPRAVDRDVIASAVSTAQLAPSACNRQPWRVHVFSDRLQIDTLLKLQNGNRGFGHTAPVLLIICAEAACFFDASERNETYVDGGLFAMALLLALQARGLSSCCLNWCVEPAEDAAAHQQAKLSASERIVMFMVVGHAAPDALVPRSPRRPLDDVLLFHPTND